MEKSAIKFEHETNDKYISRCVFNTELDGITPCNLRDENYDSIVNQILKQSNNTDEFIDNFISNQNLKNTQAYATLIKYERPQKQWYAVREMFGDKCFETESDAGSLKIGNSEFSILINNNIGDGVTCVAIFNNEKEFYNADLMDFTTLIQGHFYIYNYDCGECVCKELNGKYVV